MRSVTGTVRYIRPSIVSWTFHSIDAFRRQPGRAYAGMTKTKQTGSSMSDTSAVKALVFDVFGTVVDWRTSLIADFTKWSETRGIKADWTALVDGWRAVYAGSMDEVRKHPENGYVILDVLHRRSLEKLVEQFSIKGLTDADLHHLTMGWHRLHPWPDSVAGLTRLKTKYIISPLSNGNVALQTWRSSRASRGTWSCRPNCSSITSPIRKPISARQNCCACRRSK
jgi:hypothetical protein